MAVLTASAYLLPNSGLAVSTQLHRCLDPRQGLSRLTVVKQSSAAAQQSIGALGGMDAVQGEHPREPPGGGDSSCHAPSLQGFLLNTSTRVLVALHELVYTMGLWMLLCKSAILGPG